jgi:DNA-binding transcriptional ArsR family regulator
MPSRQVVAKELAEIFGVLSHPDRIRMVEELRLGEIDVTNLAKALELETPRVSQHLRLLRMHGVVTERREGRRHFYHLNNPEMATWIVQGLTFIEQRMAGVTKSNIKAARRLWSE